MTDSDPTPDPPTPAEQDRRLEAAIMTVLLAEHPAQLTLAELALELGYTEEAPLAVEDAVRRLERAGLVHRPGGLIVPSRPVVYLDRLRD